jgi:hypothetical protein
VPVKPTRTPRAGRPRAAVPIRRRLAQPARSVSASVSAPFRRAKAARSWWSASCASRRKRRRPLPAGAAALPVARIVRAAVTTAMRLRPAAVARVENVLRAAMTSARGVPPATGPSGHARRERRIVRALIKASAPSGPARAGTTARASHRGTVRSAPVAMTTVPAVAPREGMPLPVAAREAAASRAVLEARPRADLRRAASKAAPRVAPRAARAVAVDQRLTPSWSSS